MTVEEYEKLTENGCNACGSKEKLHVDHDHSTGKIRGCLCASCNQALGMLKDNKDNVLKLYNYLKKHDETTISEEENILEFSMVNPKENTSMLRGSLHSPYT